jgi:hypothetical protein
MIHAAATLKCVPGRLSAGRPGIFLAERPKVIMKKFLLSLISVLLITTAAVASFRPAAAASANPVITGTGRVGDTLTIASYGSLTGDPDDFTYAWLWEGEEVPGPNDHGAAHTVTPADVGRELSVLVKPKQAGVERLASNRILATVAVLSVPAVAVAGTPKVGRVLSAAVAGGSPGASVEFQWLNDGAVIPGATAATYRVVKADGGRRLSVRATSSQAGLASVSSESGMRGVAAFYSSRPKVKGSAKVGKTLKVATRGTWYAPGYRYRYQWLRNGTKISGATKASYRVRVKDRSKRISIVVRATKTGFPTVQVASARSAKVR